MRFVEEILRRHVHRMAAAYLVTTWLIIQDAGTIFPLFGFDATLGDAMWQSLFPAPAHPYYLSIHSALSGAGVLTALFGDTQGFEFAIGGDSRAFTGLEQAALDGANSRLWGGIHFGFDNAAGLATGYGISQWALAG